MDKQTDKPKKDSQNNAKTKSCWILTVGLSLVIAFIATVQNPALNTPALARDFHIGFSFAKPPYVFASHSRDYTELKGIEIDLVEEILSLDGYGFTPHFFPYNRLVPDLKARRIDAAATVRPAAGTLFYSDPFIHFNNYAITHPDAPPIRNLEDLAGRSAVGWQGATHDLGKGFADITQKMAHYSEIASQQRQIDIFLNRRVDVIIIDKYIFRHWAAHVGHNPDKFAYNGIFNDKTEFVVGFITEKDRDMFNKGLKLVKENGTYEAIYKQYIH